MNFTKRAVSLGLSCLFLLTGSFPVFADTMLIPRLGYTTADSKRIYLDITTPEEFKADTKQRKEQEKAAKKEIESKKKEQQKELKESQKTNSDNKTSTPDRQVEKPNLNGLEINLVMPKETFSYADTEIPVSNVSQKSEDGDKSIKLELPSASEQFEYIPSITDGMEAYEEKDTYSKDELPSDKKNLTKEEKKKLRQAKKEQKLLEKKQKEDLKYAQIEAKRREKEASLTPEEKARRQEKELARKQAEAEKLSRYKARIAAIEAKKQAVPVSGNFFLYNLKKDRLQYKNSTKLETSSQNEIAPFYVEFKEDLTEGLYDLAVQGSGHRSEQPLRISNTIYWEALQPVLQDITETHCPKQTGQSRIIQQCFKLNTMSGPYDNMASWPVHGGWYADQFVDTGLIKDTTNIATVAQILLSVYKVNPGSYKYLALYGDNFAQSHYPDLLDEINWGLQYLLTIQQDNGGVPDGIEKQVVNEKTLYKLLPVSSEATARAVATLATAAKSFQQEDLSLAIKFMRSAEKGWRYLQTHIDKVDPELMFLASSALMQTSDNPEYKMFFEQTKPQVLDLETALLIPSDITGQFAIKEIQHSGKADSKEISDILPLLLQLRGNTAGAYENLSQFITNLYGYEKITLVKDADLEMVSAWQDPLQWAASKTGQVAIRFSQNLSDNGIYRDEKQIDSEFLKNLEEKDKLAQKRIQAGYDSLTLTTKDKAYLAYALALLNQQIIPDANRDPLEKKEPEQNRRYEEPQGSKKGFYPKPI